MAKTFLGKLGAKNMFRVIFLIYALVGVVALWMGILLVKYFVDSTRNVKYTNSLMESMDVTQTIIIKTSKLDMDVDDDVVILSANQQDGLNEQTELIGQPEEADDSDTANRYVEIPASIDFAELTQINGEVIGWIYQPYTGINYPIVQGQDNEYYLNHLINGEKNKYGSVFADARIDCPLSDPETIIYGHNMKDGTMFGSLNSYKKQSYYDANPNFYLYTPDGRIYVLKALGGMTLAADSDFFAVSKSGGDNRFLVEQFTNGSTFNASLDAISESYRLGDDLKLMMLSTCTGNSLRRYVVLTSMVEVQLH